MATAYQNSSNFEEYIRDLLECPVCMDTIKSVPVYQCANGHVICQGCIDKLNNCPICRNDSELRRSLKLEDIVQRIEGIQPENEKTGTALSNLKKWGKGSDRVYRTTNSPNPETRIELNHQANPEFLDLRNSTEGAVVGRPVGVTYLDPQEKYTEEGFCLVFSISLFFIIFLLVVCIFVSNFYG